MRTSDLLRFALLFLARRKTRTFLTVLGVIIGTVCIVLMLSMGVANYTAMQEMIEGRTSLTEVRITADTPQLSQGDIEEMTTLPHVAAASPIVQVPGILRTGSYEAFVSLIGTDSSVLELQFAQGGMFLSGTSSPELVVGGDAVRDFIDPENPPDYMDWEAYEAYSPDIDWLNAGFTFQFGYDTEESEDEALAAPAAEIPVRVCGVTEQSANMDAGYIYIDISAARQILMQNAPRAESMGISLNTFPEALVRVDSMENVEEVLGALRDLGFDASGDLEYINDMRDEQSRQLLQLLLIGLVSLVVSAIGIANTMYAGILERRRDIGILKVLGMRKRRIQRLFLMESALIGLVGGLIGLGISWIATAALNTGSQSGSWLGMYFAEGTQITIPPWIGSGAVLVACATGILAGQWPAAKAARMSALDAMRTGA